jgi:hypothetical protein
VLDYRHKIGHLDEFPSAELPFVGKTVLKESGLVISIQGDSSVKVRLN